MISDEKWQPPHYRNFQVEDDNWSQDQAAWNLIDEQDRLDEQGVGSSHA